MLTLIVMLGNQAWAQRGPGQGRGQGFRGGRGPGVGHHGLGGPDTVPHGGHAHDQRHDADREVFQFLLSNHKKINRTVKQLPDGVKTVTESDVDEIADRIKEHVHWMQDRIKNTNPIRMRDPLFAEIFRHADKITMTHQETEKGVRVTETSKDPYVAKLIQEHARVVSGFVERGFAEAMKNHAVPITDKKPSEAKPLPLIAGHGAVVQLPQAVHQPRDGAKLLIDITQGGDHKKLLPSIERIVKYANLYHAAGAKPASARFAVVFHGDATLAVLNPDAYARRFKTEGNPNLDLLHQLHEAGVQLSVCGQSLISKGSKPEDVAVFIDTAVSALTAVVNHQADGYAYVPILR
ncbi:MAG: DsrE family protein [Planctomycetota bacterium]